MENEIEEVYSDEGIECPYCGYLDDEGESIHCCDDEDCHNRECGSCGKSICYVRSVMYSWITYPRGIKEIEEEIKNEEKNRNRHKPNEYNWSNALRKDYQGRIDDMKKEIEKLKEKE